MKNRVLRSLTPLIQSLSCTNIDEDSVNRVARSLAEENLTIPAWDAPVFLKDNGISLIESFILGNSINFAFKDFESKDPWQTDYLDVPWKGSFGMWASITRALQDGYPLLDADYLANISSNDMQHIFRGNMEIPMLKERINIFREVGNVVDEKYEGSIYNIYLSCEGRLFNSGKGLVERLTHNFPSFDDSLDYEGYKIRFDKRAQLAPAMIYGRLLSQGIKIFSDIDELTVFADYCVPRSLRSLGILHYNQVLADKVDNQILIPAGSREELEIRASTIYAAKMLQDRINEYRKDKVNALHIDYRLWSESRGAKKPHHLTKTIAY